MSPGLGWARRLARAEAVATEARLAADAAWLAATYGGTAVHYLGTLRRTERRTAQLARVHGEDLGAIAAASAAEFDCPAEEILKRAQEIAAAREVAPHDSR
jgi:hypothetical protein